MNEYKIDELISIAYQNAIQEVIDVVNRELGLSLFYFRDWSGVETLACKLGLRFTKDGNIIK